MERQGPPAGPGLVLPSAAAPLALTGVTPRCLTAWGSRLGDARRLCRQPVPGRPALRPRDRERPDPQPRPGWSVVTLRTVGLNHHDIFSLKGVGLPADRLPMVLGCDGAGVDEDGNEVIVHAVVPSEGWQGDETLDPKRLLLSEPTTAPSRRRSPSPRPTWSASPPACPGSTRPACPRPGSRPTGCSSPTPASRPARRVVQGAGGGVATALVQLGSAAGYRMRVTSRDEAKGKRAVEIGADRAFGSGERLPERVDAVMETVGAATWSHSINSLNPGGTIVISGATSGDAPAKAELTKIFFKQLRVIGSTMGTRRELGGWRSSWCSSASSRSSTPCCRSSRPARASPRWRRASSSARSSSRSP